MEYASKIDSNRNKFSLPVHILNWEQIKNKNLRRIIFQFEIERESEGELMYNLIAYCAFRKKGKWKLDEKITLEIVEDKIPVSLELPITLGNLELRRRSIKKLRKAENKIFTLTPELFKDNPHVTYVVSDGTSDFSRLDPSPPAPPARSWE